MITGELRQKIDALWGEFWTGGIANPLTVIEQISFLMFARLLDLRESTEEKRFDRVNKGKDLRFPGLYFGPKQQHLRWSQFKHRSGDEMLTILRDGVFPHFRTLGNLRDEHGPLNTFAEYMKDASLIVQRPSLLVTAVNMIDELPLTQGDTKGDLYEYMLGKLQTAGINGQFRTPRHIIRLMVDLILQGNEEEALSWRVGDPACGTAGFLVSFAEALKEHFTSEDGKVEQDDNGQKYVVYTGDLLTPAQRKHMQQDMLHGFDFDVTMLRVAAMNLMLHGIDTPDIHYQDTLGTSFPEKFPKLANNGFDLILANPPFKGALDFSDVHPTLTGKVKTKKTELLFLVLILRMLRQGGRCAVVVPDGVLFGSSCAHRDLREMLIDQHQLEAVVKLPSGAFRPYAGVNTAILFFTKDGKTKDVWFYDVQADGLSLDDKRLPVEENDLPDVRTRWRNRDPKKDTDRKAKAFFVPVQLIRTSDYDLSISRYKEVEHKAAEYDKPRVIMQRLAVLDEEIAKGRSHLEEMLR